MLFNPYVFYQDVVCILKKQMKNQILILLSTILFLSSGEQKKEKTLIEKKTVKVEISD